MVFVQIIFKCSHVVFEILAFISTVGKYKYLFIERDIVGIDRGAENGKLRAGKARLGRIGDKDNGICFVHTFLCLLHVYSCRAVKTRYIINDTVTHILKLIRINCDLLYCKRRLRNIFPVRSVRILYQVSEFCILHGSFVEMLV